MNALKKISIVLLAIILPVSLLTAQEFHVEKSDAFDEPGDGWTKVLQLKNGNTFLFHGENSEGIDVSVYDKSRKMVSKKKFISTLWNVKKLEDLRVEGVYEINGEPVVFFLQTEDWEPELYRIRFNAMDGSLVKEEEIGRLGRTNDGALGTSMSGVSVEKDPASDCYAVCYYTWDPKNLREIIKVHHYNGSNVKISEADYKTTGNRTDFSSMIVDGDKSVFMALVTYDGMKASGSTYKFVISRLNAGEKTFTDKVINIDFDLINFHLPSAALVYNKGSNSLQLLTITLTNSKKQIMTEKVTLFYSVLITYIDPVSMHITGVKPLYGEKVQTYATKHIDKDYNFPGLPQGMVINKDNTTTFLMEEMTSTGIVSTARAVGVSVVSDTGAELSGFVIDKKQQTKHYYSSMFQNDRNKGIYRIGQSLDASFMSYKYFDAPRGRYVVFNDMESNITRNERDSKRDLMTDPSGTSAICYKLSDSKVDKFPMFGKPVGRSSTHCLIEGSDYNSATSTYATIIIERNGRDNQARLAWVTFD